VPATSAPKSSPGWNGPGSPASPGSPGASPPASPAGPMSPDRGPRAPQPLGPNSPWSGPPVIGPTTPAGSGRAALDPNRWQLWWQFNHDRFLSRTDLVDQRHRLTGDGPTGDGSGVDERRLFREIAAPVLKHHLVHGGDSAVLREVLLTAARLADEDRLFETDLLHYARFYLDVDQPELRAAAIKALGIAAVADGIGLLASVLANDESAQELLRQEVPENERALAAFALGMIGREARSEDLRRSVVYPLLDALRDESVDVRVAASLALGRAPLAVCDLPYDGPEEGHACGQGVLEVLVSLALDDEEDDLPRAHATTSIGRLGFFVEDEKLRERVGEVLFHLVHPSTRVDERIRHAGVIALGLFGRGGTSATDEEVVERLHWLVENGDELTRRLSMTSLSSICDRSGVSEENEALVRHVLVSEIGRGRRDRRSWATLALAPLGSTSNSRVHVSPGFALREGFTRSRNTSEAAACALGMGLLGDESAATCDLLWQRFERTEDPEFRAYAGLALGLLGVQRAKDLLQDELVRDRGFAVPLSLLGDASLLERLLALLGSEPEQELARSVEVADALGATKDPAALRPLAEILARRELPPALRSHAAAAIGELCDGDSEHWTAVYAENLLYEALTSSLMSEARMGAGLLDGR